MLYLKWFLMCLFLANTQEVLTKVVDNCSLSGGVTYVVYFASDVDSHAGQLVMLSAGDVTFELQCNSHTK